MCHRLATLKLIFRSKAVPKPLIWAPIGLILTRGRPRGYPYPPAPIGALGQVIPERSEGKSVRTYSPKPGDAMRKWHVIDAEGVVLGRVATHAAALLRGKHKPTFAPHMDMGDFVIVINADKIALSGQKSTQKFAHTHSGFPGGLTSTVYGDLLVKHPTRAVEKAIKGMLPKNTLGRAVATKLKVYAGPEHPHAAQAPVSYVFDQVSQIIK